MRSRGSSGEGSGECGNLSHSGGVETGLGNTLLLRLNDCLVLLLNNYLLLGRSVCCEEFSVESFHFSLKCENFSGLTNRSNYLGRNHRFRFGLDNCLLLRSGSSSGEGSGECGNLSHSGGVETGLGNTLLLRLNDCLVLLLNNYLLLGRSVCCEEFSVESFHFSLKCENFCRLTNRSNYLGSNHSLCFGLNDYLLLLSSGSSGKCGSKCGNFCHCFFSGRALRLGDALLLSLYNCLLFSFNNCFLFFNRLCLQHGGVEIAHCDLKLLECFCAYRIRLCSLDHSLLFSNNNGLLFLGSICGGKSSVEFFNFCCKLVILTACFNKTLCFSSYNCLLLLLRYNLLFCGSSCSDQICIEYFHFALECELLRSFLKDRCLGKNHHLRLGLNDRLFLLGSGSSGKCSGESGNFCHSGCDLAGLGNALLLCLYNGFLLLLCNCFLLCGSLSGEQFSIKGFHFSLECKLFCGLANRSYLRINHSLGFGLNDYLFLFGSSSCSESGSECCNLCHGSSNFAGLSSALLLCLNNGIFLLLSNDLLLGRSFSRKQLSIQCFHFSLKCENFCGLTGGSLNCLGLNHSLCFGLNDSLLLFSCGSSGEGSGESSHLSHSGSNVTGFGNALLLCLNDGIFLLLSNDLLLGRSFSRKQLSIQCFHFSLESENFCGLTGGSLNCLGLNHSLCFGLNDSLLLFSSSSSGEGSGESSHLSHSGSNVTGLGNALLLRLNDGVFLLLSNGLLLCRGLSSEEFSVESFHFSLECENFCRFFCNSCFCFLRLRHHSGFSLNDSLLLFSSGSSGEGSGESSHLSHSGSNVTGLGNASLLRLNDGIFLLLSNGLLLCRGLSSEELCIESFHFSLKCENFCRLFSSYCFCLNSSGCHSLGFFGNDSLLFCHGCCCFVCCIECGNFSGDGSKTIGTARNTFFLCVYNRLFFLVENSFLLCGGLSGCIFLVEGLHLGIELSLLSLSGRSGGRHSLHFFCHESFSLL